MRAIIRIIYIMKNKDVLMIFRSVLETLRSACYLSAFS
jgi:hypothetical protein